MKRRYFIAGALTASAIGTAGAQQAGKVYRLAIAHPSHPVSELSANSSLRYFRAFFEELKRLGYVEGQNLVVARFSAEGKTEIYAAVAHEAVRSNPDVIYASANRMVVAVAAATTTIPIVCTSGDVLASGLAASLAHPGGNVNRGQHRRRSRDLD
jgi:putative ABC transport system substrate-binding protein